MPAPAAFSFQLPRTRGELVYALAAVGILSGMAISLPLWLTGRTFPHLPCAAMFAPWAAPWDAVLLGVTAVLLLVSVFLSAQRWTWEALAGCVLLALQDQMRWQPWFYQYLLMLAAALACGGRRVPGYLTVLRILTVGLYVWSGLHKLTPAYRPMFDATFTNPLTGEWPDWAVSMVSNGGSASPWVEILLGLALLFRPTRKAGVAAAVAVHAGILLLSGPAGVFTNVVIWPWNLVMIAAVPLLFWGAPDFGWRGLQGPRLRAAAAGMLLLAGVMPAFSRAEKWDRYLSFHLYSGSGRRMMVAVDAKAAAALPPEWQKYLQPAATDPNTQELHFLAWSLAEMRVPPPGDQRLLLALAWKLADMDFAKRGQVIFYTDYSFLREKGYDYFTVTEVQRMRSLPELRRKF